MTYVADSASDGGTEAAGVITWNLSDVATGTKTLTYQVTVVAESGPLPNHAEACVPAFNDFEEACDGADDDVRVPGLSITKAVRRRGPRGRARPDGLTTPSRSP